MNKGIRNKRESNCDFLNRKQKPWRKSKPSWEDDGVCRTGNARNGNVDHRLRNKRLEFRKVRVVTLATEVRFHCIFIKLHGMLTDLSENKFFKKACEQREILLGEQDGVACNFGCVVQN